MSKNKIIQKTSRGKFINKRKFYQNNKNVLKNMDMEMENGSDEENIPLVDSAVSLDRPNDDIKTGGYILYEVPEPEEEDDDVIDEDEDEDSKNLKIDLFQSILTGDCKKVRRLLNNGAPSQSTCKESRITALHLAAFLGRIRIIRSLKRHGADVKKVDVFGRTPLDFAVWSGQEECVKELLGISKVPQMESIVEVDSEKQKNIFVKDEFAKIPDEIKEIWYDNTPLHIASARTNINCFNVLLENGFSPKNLDRNELSPLDVCGEACKKNGKLYINISKFEECVKMLIKYEDILYKPRINKMQSNPLHKAVYYNCKDIIKSLVEVAAYRNGYDESGQTPLHVVVASKKRNLLSIFIFKPNSNENDLDFSNKDGFTPLHLSILNKWRKGTMMLLKGGANILARNKEGDTALHIAASVGSTYIIQDIIKGLADKENQINIKNRKNETPLFKAVTSGGEHRVIKFIKEGASLCETIDDGYNVLHEAVINNHVKILRILLQTIVELPEKNTILESIIEEDSKYGGLTPLHLAVVENKLECVKILLNYVSAHLKTTKYTYTTLHLAAIKGHLNIIQFLIEKYPDLVDERDYENWKPFFRAVHKGHRDCITYFLEKGADLSEKLPKEANQTYIIELLINNLPRSVDYLENLFDKYITKNECEINDECCEITIDYSILIPESQSQKKKIYDNQMSVVVALATSGKRLEQKKLLLHPFIESFLYMKWMRGLRTFYIGLVLAFLLYVASLTWFVLNIYGSSKIIEPDVASTCVLCTFVVLLILQESSFIVILLTKRRIRSYFRRITGILNWISLSLSISIMVIDHTIPDRNWPKLVTATAIVIPWLQITILLSHFPKCGYILQMFSTVASRALKVIAIFGIHVIIGFALAFLVMFHGQPSYNGFVDSLVKTIVMTSEFDYEAAFEHVEEEKFRLMVQLVFVIFIFIVPIVMMNLILALIISDTKDLETEGKIMRLSGQVHLIDILDTVIHFLSSSRSKVIRTVSIYPGKPAWEAISLVSKNLEQSLFSRIAGTKNNEY